MITSILHRACCALVLALGVSGPAQAETVTVFAAASLRDALQEIAPLFAENTGHRLVVSLAGSSALARQIEMGAPADVFISANSAWMDRLEESGLLRAGSRTDLLGNALVLIGHEDGAIMIGPDMDLAARLGEDRLAMALVDAVPAGIYGKAALSALGQWDSVKDKVAQTDNVRAALALVSSGEAPFGIVYATDAQADPGVYRLGEFPADSHPAITYPVAALDQGNSTRADEFLHFLHGPKARAVFLAQGFTVLSD